MTDNPKDIVGRNKPGLSKLPIRPIFEAGNVLRHGSDKYGPYNWREHAVSAAVYYDAALRHLCAWWEGEDLDPDSGEHHLAHVIGGMAVLRDAMLSGKVKDDRPSKVEP